MYPSKFYSIKNKCWQKNSDYKVVGGVFNPTTSGGRLNKGAEHSYF